jgi:hypothetical protein
MQRSDLLLGEFESVKSVFRWDDGELVRLAGNGASPLLAYVPGTEDAGRHAQETMAFVAGAGVPECRRTIRAGSGATALVLEGAEDARPLALVHDLPAVTLRAGLTALLRTLNQVHARGIVHGSIDRTNVLADPSGRFWLIGWGSATPVSGGPRTAGSLSDATVDLRDLACAFREALLRRPWPDPQAATIHDRRPRTHAGQDLIDAGVKVDRDFARVLSRLVGCDPREVYSGATDVLVDLSVEDATAFDPWAALPVLGTRREVARVLRLLDDTQRATSETVRHASSVDYVGPAGSGKSRLFAEIARAARARDAIVLTAEGGARGTWGGVGALARQLVQLLGRDARMCRQHEEALRHLLDDRDPSARPQPQPAPSLGIEGRNTLTASCTAALTDMARIAFRTTPGLLLLDDEENLPAAARDVWRASGQFVQAINGAGGVLRTLLVSASTRSYAAEIGAHRVTVEMRTWRQRDLEKFLARVFASPGGTRDVSMAIHRITGGRPGDVISYLRDLESRGALRREGLRWRLDVPLAALPAVTGGVAEQVRRALDSCGRDATTLVEVLAVAADVSLDRSAVAEISDVRGPRLASAAESAIAAGLLVPDGSAWRVRTDAIAHKVRAAIPDDHRKVLHREVLQFLLDTAPAALDPIAHHARASSDPRAAAWTEQAIAEARGNSDWAKALAHLDDIQSDSLESYADTRAALMRGELLTNMGRLADAIEVLSYLTTRQDIDSELAPCVHAAFGRALYRAREWERAVDARVPEGVAALAPLAEIRYIRASALAHLNRDQESRREARLAAAELDSAEPAGIAVARLEWEYLAGFYAREWDSARQALVSKLRTSARTEDRQQFVLDLAKLANLHRVAPKDRNQARAILRRAVALMRAHPNIGNWARFAVQTTATLAETGSLRRRHRLAVRAFQVAVQSGIGQYATAARVRSIAAGIDAGRCQYADKAYVMSCASGIATATHTSLLAYATDLGVCLVFFGLQDSLELLLERLHLEGSCSLTLNPVRAMAVVGRVLLREDISDLIPLDARAADPQSVLSVMETLSGCDYPYAAVAHYEILRAANPSGEHGHWPTARLVEMTRDSCERGWGTACLALAVLLWSPVPFDLAQRDELIANVRRRTAVLPVGLQWQRLLAESHWHRRDGDIRAARAAYSQSMTELNLLMRPEHGLRGARAVASWTRLLSAREALEHNEFQVVERRAATNTNAVLRPWQLDAEVRTVLQLICDRRCGVVESVHARELELLLDDLEASGLSVEQRHSDGSTLLTRSAVEAGVHVLLFPNLWSTDSLRSATRALVSARDDELHVIALLTEPIETVRRRGPLEASLIEYLRGPRVVLPSVCECVGSDRHAFVRWSFEVFGRDLRPTDQAVDVLARHPWPGGVGEIEALVRELTRAQGGSVELSTLRSVGWLGSWGSCDAEHADVADKILNATSDRAWHSLAEICRMTGLARRTALRHASQLLERGRLLRAGRGRATRYRQLPGTDARVDRDPTIRVRTACSR